MGAMTMRWTLLCVLALTACGGAVSGPLEVGADDDVVVPAGDTDTPAGSDLGPVAPSGDQGLPPTDDDGPPMPSSLTVSLTPQAGTSGTVRVSFAVPLSPGTLEDASLVRVTAGQTELAAISRGLARWPDGSLRAVQLQVDVTLPTPTLDVGLGTQRTAGDLTLVPVSQTLTTIDVGGQSASVPRVWVTLPARWLAASGVFGPLLAREDEPAAPLDAWSSACDYATWDTAAFVSAGAATAREVWLYDRATALYRGYARRGDLATLRSAYQEASMYFSRITLQGDSATINLPQSGGTDPKYLYTQNLALHYLLTGDDRYREAAEGMATRAATSFDPVYAEGAFWTERNAGFTLLASVHAAAISDDRRAQFLADAAERVTAYLAMQAAYIESATHAASGARCFAHDKVAADEDGAYPATMVCSPWMSAILADGLEAYTHEVDATAAAPVRAALVSLARRLAAADNRDADGRPYYILGVDGQGVPDAYDEHWGETAYVIALGYHVGGRTDGALRSAAFDVANGFATYGEVGQVRSFNWQCRSAVATPFLLSP